MDPKGTLPAGSTSHARTSSRRAVEHTRLAAGERRAAVAHGRSAQPPGTGLRRSAEPFRSGTVELAQVLDQAAHRIAEKGTSAEHRLFEAMAEVAAQSAPGVAAALTDPDGTEISRLRAFGLAHTHLLESLGPREHAWLLDLLEGETGGLERSAVPA